ncbi:hypothetical protein [Arcobacter caeni]|jgi:hypothetical protein|uniref:Uncharacterized protein n=1 Tax=Arcobacter caeni TaxID=1912877 RepID=A0A363D4B0_9BACT|nr:hypothetical protein [Arcobacter caeni]PUE66103.1 hypothetical protein B0174_02225 [Arcobacter caeni]
MKKEMILQLASKLKEVSRVEFEYNNSFYEIFESTEGGYMINIYSSNEKDEDDEYLYENNFDGGLCTGTAKDAIQFML